MKQMGSEIQILFIFLPAVFLLNAHLFMADDSSSMNAAQIPDDLEMYRVEYNVDGKENQIQKVSGEDETEAQRAFVLEKFRILLGLKNFNIISSRNGHFEHGFLSPAPAPSFEAAAEVPAPVPVPHHHLHSHHLSPPRVNRTPAHRELRREHGDKDRVRGIIIAVAVSSGVALVISALGILLFCWKFRKGRRRSARTMSVSGTTDGFRGRSQYVNSPNSINKVSLELGLYLNSLGSVSDPVSSCLKHTSETVNKQSNQTEKNSSLEDVGSESDKDSMKSIHCSSAEEILSVHVVGEPTIKREPNVRNCSLPNEIVPIENLSSDDESFHSFCHSHSSNVRGSNASEGDMSDRSEILSPLNNPERFSTPDHDHSSIPPKVSFSRKSPNRSVTRKRTPPLHSNLNSSPLNTACNPRQTTPTSLVSSNSSQHFPPPPPLPPPAPSLNFASSQSPFSSNRNASKQLLPSTKSDLSPPRNSDSSSGSNQVPSSSSDSSSSAHPKPQQASTSTSSLRNIPPPPYPPLPPLLLPPFVKGCNNSLQPPPPPPGQHPQLPPVGKDGAPLPKLKPLHWDKVRATPDRSMVWDKLKCSSFEFDEKMIESLFGYNLQKAMKNDETKSKSPSPSKHILEAKRLQNITILLKALNTTAEQVCDALIQGDGLCLQQLEALVKMVPTKEEESLLLKFQGNINELSYTEKFVRAMLNIPFAFLRVEGMLFRETFEDEIVHLRKSFAMLEEACKELRSSQLFLKLLEAVLKTGNRMNVGTIRGGARAFKLDALLKLADVKGTDGKTTLLHFVVQEMIRSEGITESDTIIIKKSNQKSKNNIVEEREEDYRRMGLDHVSSLSTELCNVKKTATIDLDVLASTVSNLSEGMVKLQHLVHEALSMDEQKGKFSQSMKSFLSYAENNIKELKKDEDRVLLHVRQITEYFHGNVSKEEANPLRIFVIVRDFLGMLDQVCKEIRSLKMPKIPNPLAPFQ